jgi:hypothetical protein
VKHSVARVNFDSALYLIALGNHRKHAFPPRCHLYEAHPGSGNLSLAVAHLAILNDCPLLIITF